MKIITVGLSIVSISIILSIPVIISGHNAFESEYDYTLMTWKGIEGGGEIAPRTETSTGEEFSDEG